MDTDEKSAENSCKICIVPELHEIRNLLMIMWFVVSRLSKPVHSLQLG